METRARACYCTGYVAGTGELTGSCGRHECGRVCCPLAYKAKSRKKKANAHAHDDPLSGIAARREGEDDAHECMLTCGKLLSCGLHTCARKDHKGACGRCLQASYDELICHCGETIIYPPVAWYVFLSVRRGKVFGSARRSSRTVRGLY